MKKLYWGFYDKINAQSAFKIAFYKLHNCISVLIQFICFFKEIFKIGYYFIFIIDFYINFKDIRHFL